MNELTDDNINIIQLKNTLKDEDKMAIIYLTANWCGPCKRIYPLILEVINKLSKEYNKKFIFYKADIDKNDLLSEIFNVQSVPTFILINNEVIIDRFTGADIDKFKELLKVGYKFKDNITIDSK
ncbi:MAG: hypothetical protein CMG46_01625 [Candidatus Marinimicrobia bacterium]|nr:hypothetical protein [Candidatus Neomarinimicrobiota bacterium]